MKPTDEEPNAIYAWDIDDFTNVFPPDEPDDDLAEELVLPGVEEYIQAFEAISSSLTPQQKRMLQAHYHSGGRAVTMRELAKTSGYGDYKIANVQYGTVAKWLVNAMGIEAPVYGKQPLALLILGQIVDRKAFGLEMHLVMYDNVATALETLEMV
jgi:hypothetical protein